MANDLQSSRNEACEKVAMPDSHHGCYFFRLLPRFMGYLHGSFRGDEHTRESNGICCGHGQLFESLLPCLCCRKEMTCWSKSWERAIRLITVMHVSAQRRTQPVHESGAPHQSIDDVADIVAFDDGIRPFTINVGHFQPIDIHLTSWWHSTRCSHSSW